MNRVPELAAQIRAEILASPLTELPAITGQLAALDMEIRLRFAAPSHDAVTAWKCADRLLDVEETAKVLGQTSRWVRSHRKELPFVKLPGRSIRFSERHLNSYIQRRLCR